VGAEKIYVSYSWQAEKEKQVVDKLEEACKKRSIVLKRDRSEISYKDSIRNFMNELAAGDAVILVLSEAYFKSPSCMYSKSTIK
jgi:internalin A